MFPAAEVAGKRTRRARLRLRTESVRPGIVFPPCCVADGLIVAVFCDLNGSRRGKLSGFEAAGSLVMGAGSFDMFASALYRDVLHFEKGRRPGDREM